MDRVRITRIALLILLSLSIIFSGTGHLDRLIGYAGVDRLARSNEAYLKSSFDEALKGFLVLSGLKMGLAVIKDSDAGISLGVSTRVHIGGVVQSAYDYVDIAWKVLLGGSAILLGLEYIARAAAMIDGMLLTVMLVVLLMALLFKWFAPSLTRSARVMRDIASFTFILTFSLYLVVPLSIAGGSLLSRHITEPSIKEAGRGIAEMQESLFPEGYGEDAGLVARLKGAKRDMERAASEFRVRAKELSVWIIKIITGYLFNCILFPLLTFLLLYWLLKWGTAYLFGLNREQDLVRDLAALLNRHYELLSDKYEKPLPHDEINAATSPEVPSGEK